MENWVGVIMAAGKGTRMKSRVPKVLHKLCGRELLSYPVEALRSAGIDRIVVVVSPENEAGVKGLLGEGVEYVSQDRPLGTGHALLQAASTLEGRSEYVIAMNADLPLIRVDTLQTLCSRHLTTGPNLTLLSATRCSQDEFGKVEIGEDGRVKGVVEAPDLGNVAHSDAEINAGVYCFNASWLWDQLPRIQISRVGEVYLTSLVAAAAEGGSVERLVLEDPQEALGVNNRVQLAQAEAAMRQRVRERWMLEGVTLLDPPSTFLDALVELGQDTVIYPNTFILGCSRIGRDCSIGPGTVIRDSVIGDGCTVTASFLEAATVEESVEIGPFSHLRPGAHVEGGVHIGNFSEIKNSRLGRGVKMGHFGYVGDASIGADVNLGAGMVTCNYDGVEHHRTVVENGAFIGSDTMLVAPVRVGEGASTGAGAVVTKDVPPRRLAVGVPARIMEGEKGSSTD